MIVLGLLLMIAGLVQAVLMMFREGALVILAGVTVLAAAGTFTHATRPWLPRVLGWMLALICYKPAAALVYASALALVGEGDDPRTVLVGLTMLVLAIVALPALMKFFTWTTGAVSSSGGTAVAALAGASAAAIHAGTALGSSGRSASGQADHIRQDLGPAAGNAAKAYAPPAGAATAAGTSTTGSGAAAGAGAAGPAVVVTAGAQVASGAAQAGRAAGDTITKDSPS